MNKFYPDGNTVCFFSPVQRYYESRIRAVVVSNRLFRVMFGKADSWKFRTHLILPPIVLHSNYRIVGYQPETCTLILTKFKNDSDYPRQWVRSVF